MAADFIDTNVFIYTLDNADPVKRDQARQLIADAIEHRSGTISHQVVQETLNVLLGKARVQMDATEAQRFLQEMLLPLWTVVPTPSMYSRAVDLQSRYQYSFYDSLIIAAALHAGCSRILSEDLQHGQRIETLTIENPFLKGMLN